LVKGIQAMAERVSLLFLLALTGIAPQPAFPQGLTGTLIGTVKDEQGGILPGALVQVSSRALIGGPATMPTNEKGQLRFQVLPPGSYVLDRHWFFAGYQSYGRIHQGVLTSELPSMHRGQTPTTTTAFDAATGGYTRLVSVVDPKINLRLDPTTRSPRTDEYSVGMDRET
jgi:hypothetical protein